MKSSFHLQNYTLCTLLFLVAFFWSAVPQSAQAEVIRSFEADITPEGDGSFMVEETIEYDFEEAHKRGIFRIIENEHAQDATAWYKDRTFGIELLSVTRDGASEQYLIESDVDPFRIRIGDPDVTIIGPHTYTVRYRVDGALAYYEDPSVTELYWNVTGDEWPVRIESASVSVRDSNGWLLDERACYAGPPGSTERCELAEATPQGARFVASNLAPGEEMTIAQALDPELVEVQVKEEANYWFFVIPVAIFWLIGLSIWAYRYKTWYKLHRAHMVQYEPYGDFKPMFTGVLFDGRLDPHDITAGIVYLAEQGFIKIKKTEEKVLWLFNVSDYEITMIRNVTELDSDFLRELLTIIFSTSTPPLERSIRLSNIKHNSSKRRKNHLIIQRLRKALVQDLVERNYFEKFSATVIKYLIVLAVLSFVVLPFLLQFSVLIFVFLIFWAVSIFMISAIIYRRRTQKGYEALWHLEGFKDFLSMTEKERYDFHNAPEKSPEMFMQYLPYAIAFGVEEKWAKVFADITIPDPDWYEGGSAARFSATSFTSDLGSFSSSFASSSGSSGSSGGGSSGGGSGGGGGSW